MELKDYSEEYFTSRRLMRLFKARDEANHAIKRLRGVIDEAKEVIRKHKKRDEAFWRTHIQLEKDIRNLGIWERDLLDTLQALVELERKENGKIHA